MVILTIPFIFGGTRCHYQFYRRYFSSKILYRRRIVRKKILCENSFTSHGRSVLDTDSSVCSPFICWLSSKFVIPPSGTASSRLHTGQGKVPEPRSFLITYSSRHAKHIESKHGKTLGFWKVP